MTPNAQQVMVALATMVMALEYERLWWAAATALFTGAEVTA